jgi:hypothetical protein
VPCPRCPSPCSRCHARLKRAVLDRPRADRTPASCPCTRRSRAPPSSSALGTVQGSLTAPHGLPTTQHHCALPARPGQHQDEGRRDQLPGAPPAAVPRPLLPTCGPQNQTLSTPRPFPRPPPAKPRRGSPEFGPPVPAGRP